MNSLPIAFGMLMVVSGTVVVAATAWRSRTTSGHLAYLREVGDMTAVPGVDPRLEEPLARRILAPLAGGALRRLGRFYPPTNLDRIHGLILQAGLSDRIRAEEFATVQVLSLAGGIIGAAALTLVERPPERLAVLAFLVLPAVGLLAPQTWIQRRARLRAASIQRDLPDVLDLLTISVEAGLGLEQAIEAASADLNSPLGEELALTLREMSLGLSRHDALDNLRRRTSVEDLSGFVVVLMQADALGMPIGRVLRAQADEMRAKRRQRAREQAAKLPVKVLFPLVLFVFPPMMIIVLGPAFHSILKAVKI